MIGELVFDTNGVEVLTGTEVELTNGVEASLLVFNGVLVLETNGVDVFNGADVEFKNGVETGALVFETNGVDVFNGTEVEFTKGVGSLVLAAVGIVAFVNCAESVALAEVGRAVELTGTGVLLLTPSLIQLNLLLVVVITVSLGALLKKPNPSLASISGRSVVTV